jgi:hypothetical protein
MSGKLRSGVVLRPRSARSTHDDGAAAVEFALVSLLLFTLLFGVIEFSLLLRDNVSVSSAVRSGARIASAEPGAGHVTACPTTPAPPPPCAPATVPQLAQDAADAVQRSATAMPKNNIDEMWVYKANSSGFPGSYTDWSTARCDVDTCVKFVWVDANSRFQYSSGTWTSTSIAACTGPGKADAVGVIIKATHKFLLGGIFGTTTSMRDRAVMQFEPLPNATCASNGGHP